MTPEQKTKRITELRQEIAEIEAQYTKLVAEDRTEYAQGIIDKMFLEFDRGQKWVSKMQYLAENKYYVYSPIGRIRHLYAAMTQDKRIVSKQVRRGMNAPIQGFASEIGVKASHLIMEAYYEELPKIKSMLNIETVEDIEFNRIVHDASYFTIPHCMVIPFIHILQYQATYGVTQAYEKEFGLKFTVEPEIELEVAVRDSSSRKWDWSLPELTRIIEVSVDEGIAQGIYSDTKAAILEKIYEPWRNKEVRTYLNEKYPLLGVDLYKEIGKAVPK